MVAPTDEMVTITKKEYESLLDDSLWRNAVVNAGVDNWEGFEFAMKEYHGEENDG